MKDKKVSSTHVLSLVSNNDTAPPTPVKSVRVHPLPFVFSFRVFQDHSQATDGFKARLVHRDKGCLVCKAAREPLWTYSLQEDSGYFEGQHIFPLQYYARVSPS